MLTVICLLCITINAVEIIIYFVVVYFIVKEDSKTMAQRCVPTEAGVGSHPLYF
jgi:hypothetical protein